MTERGRAAAIVAAVFVVDRITKAYIRSSFSAWDITPVIPRFFNIVHTENPGAAFGMLSDSAGLWRQLFLIAISLVVMVVIGVMLWAPHRSGLHESTLLRVGLALVFGGALGNVWDRLFGGTVTDFLQFLFGSYEFPAFNAADSAITVGAALLVIDLWRTRHHESPQPQT
ncbi:MAG: signal peptidase II [Bryobacterales bacterium]|nr:signal peptidase II [Bryobacterales bacterium]MBV9396819.1 signal peptidase II [Bryobacterales bacterium]